MINIKMKNILFVLPKFVDSKEEPYILPLSEWKDSAILIMSSRYNFDIYREFIELGTEEEQILTVKMI